ncbi:MAG: hypothetical protein HeimC3_10920 [Candidatus Heimdallarchaeota archaeon LC_3]|nr:MAG: hypothetical protein HeimC3_10920 [Candidatus Heimdallarchaeota archaeon LC_3]
MPKISGIELVKFITRNNIRADIIASTGNNDFDETFWEAGFIRVLRKSTNFHENLEEFYKIIVSYSKIIKMDSLLE